MALWPQKFWAEVLGQSYWEFGKERNKEKRNGMEKMKEREKEEKEKKEGGHGSRRDDPG